MAVTWLQCRSGNGAGIDCREKPGRGTATSMSGVEVPGRFLPLPVHASEAARAMLAVPSTMAAATPYPADDDKAGWRDHVEAVNAQLIGAMQPMMAGLPVEISDDRIGGVPEIGRASCRERGCKKG